MAKRTPRPSAAYYRHLDRLRKCAPVAELAEISEQMHAVGVRLRDFSFAHRGGCKCPLCVDVRRIENHFPNLMELVLAAAATVLELQCSIDSLRPLTQQESSELDERFTARTADIADRSKQVNHRATKV